MTRLHKSPRPRWKRKGELSRSVLWTLAISLFAITAGHEILVKRVATQDRLSSGVQQAEMGPFTAWFRRTNDEPDDEEPEEEEKATACVPRTRSSSCGARAFQPHAPFGPQR